MSNSYKKLMEIKNSCRFDYFVMAVSHYLDIGHRNAQRITEAEIKAAKGNDIMSKEFVGWLMETAKKIADSVDTAVEVVQFCMAEDVFDIRYYANKMPGEDLERMVKYQLDFEFNGCPNMEDVAARWDYDVADFELLGYEIPEEV